MYSWILLSARACRLLRCSLVILFRDSADFEFECLDCDDLPAVLALRVKGSLYPFRWVARWHPSAPTCMMVYIGFQLISTGDLPDDEVAPFKTTQKCWDVRDQKAFHV